MFRLNNLKYYKFSVFFFSYSPSSSILRLVASYSFPSFSFHRQSQWFRFAFFFFVEFPFLSLSDSVDASLHQIKIASALKLYFYDELFPFQPKESTKVAEKKRKKKCPRKRKKNKE